VKFKVVAAADNANFDNDAEVSVVNNFFHSMFSSIDFYLNNKLVSNDSDLYPYRAYIENLQSYSKDCQDTQLRAFELWDKDTATHMQDNTTGGANDGWKRRRLRIRGSTSCELMDDYI
jgi:hypothetical protein